MTQYNIPTQTHAAALDGYGGPEVLTLHTLPVPPVGDDELLLQVHTAGVGVWDAFAREGKMLPQGASLPLVPGTDASGTVLAVGSAVTSVAPGDRVYLYSSSRPHGGMYTEYAVTKAVYAAPVPTGLPLEQAGAMPADAVTALSGLDTLALPGGTTLLIFGASGGIGHLAVQLAKRQGLRVVAVASGPEGVALVQRLGADLALDGHDGSSDLLTAIRSFAPNGVDGLLASAGGDALARLLPAVRPGGVVAHPNGVQPVPTAPNGVTVRAYNGVTSPEQLQRLNALIASGPFEVYISGRFPLAQAAQAHQRLQSPYLGKIVLDVAD